jgi:hypothetical protein
MRRYLSIFMISLLLLGGTLSLSGCIIAPPRPARIWYPGYWGGGHVWVTGHYGYR